MTDRIDWNGTIALLGVPLPDGGASQLGQQRVLGTPDDPSWYTSGLPMPLTTCVPATGRDLDELDVVGAVETIALSEDQRALTATGFVLGNAVEKYSGRFERFLAGGPVYVSTSFTYGDWAVSGTPKLRTLTMTEWKLREVRLFSPAWPEAAIRITSPVAES